MNWRLGLIFAVVLIAVVWLVRRTRSGSGQP
jgi:hypothetical protein